MRSPAARHTSSVDAAGNHSTNSCQPCTASTVSPIHRRPQFRTSDPTWSASKYRDTFGQVPRFVLLPHRNAGRLHWGKAENTQLWDFRVGQATTGAEAQGYDSHDATSRPRLLSPIMHLPLFNEGLEVSPRENCGIKDVCRYVLEHFYGFGLIRLIIFPWNKKVNSPTNFPIFLSPDDFRDAFCVSGGAFGRPWLRWIRRLTQRTQDFTMEGIHVVGAWTGSLEDVIPQWGQSPGSAPGGQSPPKAEHVSGAENRAERAEKRLERSGAMSGVQKIKWSVSGAGAGCRRNGNSAAQNPRSTIKSLEVKSSKWILKVTTKLAV